MYIRTSPWTSCPTAQAGFQGLNEFGHFEEGTTLDFRNASPQNLFSIVTFLLLLFFNRIRPYQADFTLCLSTKSKQKTQGCGRFTRKSYVLSAEIPELPDFHRDRQSFLLKQQEFFNAFNTCLSVQRTRPLSEATSQLCHNFFIIK